MEDPFKCCAGAGSKNIRIDQVSDMSVRILIAQDRLNRLQSFQSVRVGDLVEFIRGSDNLQCLEIINLP